MPSDQVIDIEKKLRNYSVEDKQWLVKKVTEQLQLSDSQTATELMKSWDDAYSDGLDESEITMLEAVRCHQGKLSE
ncbi:hypothetical protein [Crocosphaera chwakensis]|uniref:Programmed cell death antitoxin YdcD n=1 Tax=Crocosphaera chwakensis CCY0110 TaxID=391612 RepID=A3INQ4_9CHRO|nr:hypothetical protein [Crocosphaera chwakensis]EAZ91952.1 hypothetical protein CY0110_29794 [Crocosphaera chwakensis CCY0110]